MAIYKICEIGDEVLRETAKPVQEITPNIAKLLRNMADTLYDANGVGLAAPQIGIAKRVAVIDVGDGLLELINPVIVASEGTETDVEGCLSIPGVQGQVSRAARVKVKCQNGKGEDITIQGEGLLARALQHEIDHLDGVLFVDKATNVVRK
ncbi:MAG: peptide deformylase [Peptococcaceae bacterium]|nr:peptide deformylase [Peptococcaceae bacterium]